MHSAHAAGLSSGGAQLIESFLRRLPPGVCRLPQRMIAFKQKTDNGNWAMPYGGTRTAGDMKRGGYLHNPVTLFFIPVSPARGSKGAVIARSEPLPPFATPLALLRGRHGPASPSPPSSAGRHRRTCS